MDRILVVGDVVDDIVVRPLSAVTAASDTNAEIRLHSGGSAANVAAWLGHLGAPVTFVGRAGETGAGRHTEALGQFGVDARVVTDPDHVTGTIVLTLDESGERTMYVDRGANTALRTSDVPADVWDGTGWLHLTGYSLFDPHVRPTALDLIETARARDVGISLDPSSVAFVRDCGSDLFLEWTRSIDLLLPNLDEARLLAQNGDPVRMAETLGKPGVAVAMTLGSSGSLLRTTSGEVHQTPAADVDVVDTTGAGDAYCAGLLAAWTVGEDALSCLRAGASAAAEAVAMLGARPTGPF